MDSFRRDGLTFDVRDGGPPDGEPVVLLHGFPQDSAAWAEVAPLLHKEGLRTLAPDQRGCSPMARPRGRGRYTLRETTADIRPALPGYRYRAVFRGVVENEICPVYLGRFTGEPAPDPTEVGEWELLRWADFRARLDAEGDAWSPWCREQASLIEAAGLAPTA